MTKNLQCKRHRNTNNAGPSVAQALGQYEGGQLAYFHDDPLRNMDKLSLEDACLLDTKKHFVVFDGRCAHEVMDRAKYISSVKQ